MPMENEGYIWENEMIRDPAGCVNPVVKININNLRELHAATTQGEWSDGGIGYLWASPDESDFRLVARFTRDSDDYYCEEAEGNIYFAVTAHKIWPALLDELERLRSFEHAMHCGEKSIVGLQAENERLRQQVAELEGWKRSAMKTIARWDKCHISAGSPAKPGEYTSEATEREILKLRAFEHAIHSGEKACKLLKQHSATE